MMNAYVSSFPDETNIIKMLANFLKLIFLHGQQVVHHGLPHCFGGLAPINGPLIIADTPLTLAGGLLTPFSTISATLILWERVLSHADAPEQEFSVLFLSSKSFLVVRSPVAR
jgi:hypothetical protein